MSVPLGKRGKERWPKPDKWQVILTAASLLVAIIALVGQFAQ
ncbi:hypothetical protein AB0C96_40885 [Streptomyces sp. NPDC048506]